MNVQKQYFPKVSHQFIQDCLLYSVSVRFDRMPDNSWQRMTSDKPISWIFDNLDKVISSVLEIKEHILKDEIIRWDNIKHIEVSIEVRANNTTYLFSAEIPIHFQDHFLKQQAFETPSCS